MTGDTAAVGIVGAGPVGLLCALRLASFGIRTVVLEAEPALRRQGSKACLIQGDVLEILDKVGCARQIAEEGITWHVARTYVRGREILTIVYPPRIGYGPFTNISQFRIEQVLLDRLEQEPLSEVRWSHGVTGLSQDADGATVVVETPDGGRELHFRYLVACDGVRSRLRSLAGVEWTGYTHGDRFLITDIRAELPLAHERHFHFDPPFNPGRQLVMHAQPDNVWRIDWQLPPDADIDDERRTGQLDRRIRAVIGDVPYEIDWLSTYRFHQRVVERLRVGAVLFAGDAAHALPPYGSRGMNSGLQDADNLAWKLALVLRGQAGDELLDSYHAERHAAAEENLRVTERTILFMVPPTTLRRSVRNALLRMSLPLRWMRRRVNSGRMAEPYVYTGSPIVPAASGGPLAGQFAPDGFVSVDGRRVRLRTLFGAGFVLLVFGADAAAARLALGHASDRFAAVGLQAVVVLAEDAGDLGELAGRRVTVVREADPQLRTAYRVTGTAWHLVRPDGHVAAGGDADSAMDVPDVLLRCSGAVGSPGRSPIQTR